MKISNFAKYAWAVLAFNVGVVLWGAFVRATGSGAGCGSHWPLCNGQVLPRSSQVETLIEFSHRVTSGLALLFVVILFFWAFRSFPRKNIVRLGASLSLIFIFTEALVGAGLVLFEWVAQDASTGRVISMAMHLINTFLLLAALTLTAWWATTGETVSFKQKGILSWVLALGIIGAIVLGISGAITALGDTLFPVDTLAQGIQQDFSNSAHLIVRLRIWHPIIAVVEGSYLILVGCLMALYSNDELRGLQNNRLLHDTQPLKHYVRLKKISLFLIGAVVVQIFAGLLNLVLLAPVWMQIVHLFLADLVWIGLILLAASGFAVTIADENVASLPDLGSPAHGAQELKLENNLSKYTDHGMEQTLLSEL
jgi:heme A synthase